MENNTFKIRDLYIGKVVSVDVSTHEIEVYIPKLMPTLSYGFSNTTYNVDLQSEVLKTNTLLCKPSDFKERVPDVNSIVAVFFLDEDIKKVFWRDFDPFGTNKYIEFEKVGNEKTLDDLAKLFNVNPASIIPKDVGLTLGSKDKPFAEIFGSIRTEYVVGLDEKIREIAGLREIAGDIDFTTYDQAISELQSAVEDLAQEIANNDTDPSNLVVKNAPITPSATPQLVSFDEKGLVTGGADITVLKEVSIINDDINTSPYTVNAIAGTTAPFAKYNLAGIEKIILEASGNIKAKSFWLDNSPGAISWSTVSQTIEIPMGNGIVLQNGEELYYPLVINLSGTTIPNGTPVRSDGVSGSFTKIVPMIADGSVDRALYMGLTTQEIPNLQTGRVTYFGKVGDIDTHLYTSGTELFVSPFVAGQLTNTKPTAPHYSISVGKVKDVGTVDGSINVVYNYLPKAIEVSYDNSESELSATDLQAAIDELEARVGLNDLKQTNTITNLSLGTITATNLPILSSDGTDITTLPAATSLLAGIVISGAQTFGGTKTFADDVIVTGNLTVQGDNLISNTGTVATEDDVLMLRTGASTPITTPAGLVINSYDGTNHGGMVIDANGEMRIGDLSLDANGKVTNTSQAQPVLTRDEMSNLTNMDIMVWDAINYRSIGKTLAELGLAVASGGTYTEITVVNNDIAGIPITVNGITGTTAHLQDWKVSGTDVAWVNKLGSMYANAFFDKKNTSYYLEPSNTVTSLNVAGEIAMPVGKDLVMGGLNILSSDGTNNYLKTGVNLYLENQSQSLGILTGAGRLGLGTTTPAEMLDVNGNARIQGNISAVEHQMQDSVGVVKAVMKYSDVSKSIKFTFA